MMMAHGQMEEAAAVPYEYAMYGNMEFDHSYYYNDGMGGGGGDWQQSNWHMDGDDDGSGAAGCGGSDVPLWNY
ncbi:hypothetical protein EJB05_56638, partial [Eragrostis curvula]